MEVNENIEALLKVLKEHSDNINTFIENLKQKKGASLKWTSPSTWLLPFTSKSEAKQQQPVASSDVVPKHAQSKHDQDAYSPVLEEIKKKIEILEEEIFKLLKSMEEQHSKVTEGSKASSPNANNPQKGQRSQSVNSSEGSKTEESTVIVQVYDRRGHLVNDFIKSTSKMMPNQFEMVHVKNVAEIDMKKPFLVLCQKTSRLQPDIDYAWEDIKASFPNLFSSPAGQKLQDVNSQVSSLDTTNPKEGQELQAVSSSEGSKAERKADLYAATIYVHSKDQFALPTVPSEFTTSGKTICKNMCIIDTAYTNERTFYKCEMNAKAIEKLQEFLKG